MNENFLGNYQRCMKYTQRIPNLDLGILKFQGGLNFQKCLNYRVLSAPSLKNETKFSPSQGKYALFNGNIPFYIDNRGKQAGLSCAKLSTA